MTMTEVNESISALTEQNMRHKLFVFLKANMEKERKAAVFSRNSYVPVHIKTYRVTRPKQMIRYKRGR